MLFGYLSSVDRTDVGRKRSNNEDAVLRVPEYGLFCVADGMGGADAGEVASGRIVEALAEAMASPRAGQTLYDFDAKKRLVDETVNGASRWINRRAAERGRGGSGSTVVMLLFDAVAPDKATTLHAGDSRAYRFRNGKLEQITRDHSLAEEAGYKDESKMPKQFRGVVTRGVGIKEDVRLEITPVDVREGDIFLLCSDGLSRMVPDKELRTILKQGDGSELGRLADRLIETANGNGGIDNVSVILVRAGKLEPASPPDDYMQLVEGGVAAGDDGRTTDEQLRTTDEPLRTTDETGDIPTKEPPPRERSTQEMAPPAGLVRDRISALSTKKKLLGAAGIVAAVAIVAALLVGSHSRRSAEWAAALDLKRAGNEAWAAYAQRLNDTREECRRLRAERDSEVLEETERELDQKLAGVPAAVISQFTSAVNAADPKAAGSLLEEWRGLEGCLDLFALTAAEHARRMREMRGKLEHESFVRRLQRTTDDLSLDEEAVVLLEGFLLEAAGKDGQKPSWSDEGTALATNAAVVWVRLFGNRFTSELAELGDRVKTLLVTWDNLRDHRVFVDALGTVYDDQSIAIAQGLVERAGFMRDNVRSAVDNRDANAAREALARLQTLVSLTEGTSFHDAVAEIARSAARGVDEAVDAQAGLRQAVDGFASRAAAVSRCEASVFAALTADFNRLAQRDGMNEGELQRMRQAVEQALRSMAPKGIAPCLAAYESLRLSEGDRCLEDLCKVVEVLPPGISSNALDGPLKEAAAARKEAARSIAEIEGELEKMASDIPASSPSAWQPTVDRLLKLQAHRDASGLVSERWRKVRTCLVDRVMSYAREEAPGTETSNRVAACRGLLDNENTASLLDEDTRRRLDEAVGRIGAEQALVSGLEALLVEAGKPALAALPGVMKKLVGERDRLRTGTNRTALALLDKAVDKWTESVMRAVREAPPEGRVSAATTAAELLKSDSGRTLLGKDTIAALVSELARERCLASFAQSRGTGHWRGAGKAVETDLTAMGAAATTLRQAYVAWSTQWDSAHEIIFTSERKEHYLGAMDELNNVAREFQIDLPPPPAVNFGAAEDAWASAFCRAIDARQQTILGELDSRAAPVARQLAVFGDDPAATLRDLWRFAGEAKTEPAEKLGARARQARIRLDGKRRWLANMALCPLEPQHLQLYGRTVSKAEEACGDAWSDTVERAARIGVSAGNQFREATGKRAETLSRIAKLSEQLNRNNNEGGADLETLRALLAEVRAYGQ